MENNAEIEYISIIETKDDRYIKKNYRVKVINILIRPLGHSFAVEANIKLIQI